MENHCRSSIYSKSPFFCFCFLFSFRRWCVYWMWSSDEWAQHIPPPPVQMLDSWAGMHLIIFFYILFTDCNCTSDETRFGTTQPSAGTDLNGSRINDLMRWSEMKKETDCGGWRTSCLSVEGRCKKMRRSETTTRVQVLSQPRNGALLSCLSLTRDSKVKARWTVAGWIHTWMDKLKKNVSQQDSLTSKYNERSGLTATSTVWIRHTTKL